MRLNKTEMKIFDEAVAKDGVRARDISAVDSNIRSTYLSRLARLGLLVKKGKRYGCSDNTFARILANMIQDDPGMVAILKNEGIPVLSMVISYERIRIGNLMQELGLKRSSAYGYLRSHRKRQIIVKEGGLYRFNEMIWEKLYRFIRLYTEHYVTQRFDSIPNDAFIYFETPYEVLFSYAKKRLDMQMTAFSLFPDYGIKIFDKESFYRCDGKFRKKINLSTILSDSLKIASKSNGGSSRRRLYSYLFYRKHINKLKKVMHPDLDTLKRIVELKGKQSEQGFPTYEEIVRNCEDYDIRI